MITIRYKVKKDLFDRLHSGRGFKYFPGSHRLQERFGRGITYWQVEHIDDYAVIKRDSSIYDKVRMTLYVMIGVLFAILLHGAGAKGTVLLALYIFVLLCCTYFRERLSACMIKRYLREMGALEDDND